jgi:ATP-dependent RNA helicase RhlE
VVKLEDVWVAQQTVGQVPDLTGHRCREEQVLTPCRQCGEDPADVGQEPHVEHVVRLVEHALFSVDGTRKFELLERVLEEDGFVSAIVFTRTKHRAKKLARQLDSSGHRAVALQGNMSQNQRNRAMEGFRARQFHVLVATDIAARGIDVEQVSHVVNFDMPTTPDGYTHRIGRTGRSERQGRAYTFVTPEDHELLRAVERRIGAAIPRQAFDGVDGAPVRKEASASAKPRTTTSQRQGEGPARRRRRRSGVRRNRRSAPVAGAVRTSSAM